MQRAALIIISSLIILSCERKEESTSGDDPLFTLLDSTQTGINFSNDLEFDDKFNVYTYRNFYNGGGVAIGDINNDGFADIYLTANMKSNKLYLNKGNFNFEDITESAGVGGEMGWSTGVTMADVNADGYLDIYVCNSGDIEGDKKQNELFINNGDNTFTEQAAKYQLDDRGYSTHASFFDYDKDGDLDVYLLNNSYQAIGSFNLERREQRYERDSLGGDKLLRFNGEYFEDVSEEAGIYGSIIGFGLGVTVGDLNRDGWEDIYVSNDFFERDYLYYNNQDGTFSEQLTESMKSISGASMGADMADINNDGYPDIFVTEMLPSDYERLKSVTTFENYDKYQYNVKNGYYHQFTRNTFQLNNSNQTFSEIGRLSGVEASDWSWGALIFDFDNDGRRDIFVANGIYQDLTDQDYLNYISNEEIMKSVIENDKVNYKKLIEIIPSNPISNKAFLNKGNLEFEDATSELGLDQKSFSNGAAYGDLDNDGDLDLVVNNVNMPLFIYENQAMENKEANYLKFVFKGKAPNTFAIGTHISVLQNGEIYYLEHQPTRGFQSSMDFQSIIGLPSSDSVSITVKWPNQEISTLSDVAVNQLLVLDQQKLNSKEEDANDAVKTDQLFVTTPLNMVHKENVFLEFNRDRLKYHMNSTEGPKMAQADINGDGIDDFYIGGARGYSGKLALSTGASYTLDSASFVGQAGSEDMGSAFFDADNDGDLDLYVCTGSTELPPSSSLLKDKLYINESNAFILSSQVLPVSGKYKSTSVVVPLDYDKDGDTDLFVGERLIPFQYGYPASGYLLENDGKGNFTNVTSTVAPQLENVGMITDASSVDIDQDGDVDLVVVGEYMGIHIFVNEGGTFTLLQNNLVEKRGWWNTLEPADLDGDGDTDFIVGNHGLNSRFKATEEKPIRLVVDDFDDNGFSDPILARQNEKGELFPYALRHDLAGQLKFILKKYPDYESFKDATLQEILGEEMFTAAEKFEVNTLNSVWIENLGNNNFEIHVLPVMAQLSPIYAIKSHDFDGDGDVDIVLGGNLYATKPEVGRYDASYGLYLENKGDGNFNIYNDNRGFQVSGEIRDFLQIGNKLIVARNNDQFLQFSLVR